MPTRCNRWFLLQILLFAQHVSGTIMPIIRSSRVLYRWSLPVVFGALVFKLSVWCGADGCVSGLQAAAAAACKPDHWHDVKLRKSAVGFFSEHTLADRSHAIWRTQQIQSPSDSAPGRFRDTLPIFLVDMGNNTRAPSPPPPPLWHHYVETMYINQNVHPCKLSPHVIYRLPHPDHWTLPYGKTMHSTSNARKLHGFANRESVLNKTVRSYQWYSHIFLTRTRICKIVHETNRVREYKSLRTCK